MGEKARELRGAGVGTPSGIAGPELTLVVARSELGLRLGLVASLDLGLGMG